MRFFLRYTLAVTLAVAASSMATGAQPTLARVLPAQKPPQWNDAPVLHAATPDEAGMDGEFLSRTIDSIVHAAIEAHAFPGCQLFVARGGKVVIDKSFGYHDYTCATAVEPDHLYDLASVTKMAASTLALARLADHRAIKPDDRFSKFYPPFRGTDREKITFREILTHRSGLPSGVPQPWLLTRERLVDTIRTIPLRTKVYRYSDLPFILMPPVVSAADGRGRDFETFLAEEFYRPMGVGLTFNPLEHGVPLEKIVPTEVDSLWRMSLVHGTVHDESAAVMGGVSGNAGLFGTARDMAVVMQMVLNGGVYDGIRYLTPATVEMFTRQQYTSTAINNRRALGFDRPLRGNDTLAFEKSYPAPGASQRSFGHTGFTGTIAWADPDAGLVYVLLCNRVTPSRNNPAFISSRVRYALQQAVYDAIARFEGTSK
ncbi:MAG: serine hydrolase [Alistipes sp.]|jgi:CubicO group peptidase (beta-lactamase class C family)|nr:serine hydrolase [Alistipes sp.]